MNRFRLALLLVALGPACRDEQAGPHPRGTAAGPAGASPQALTFRRGATWGQGTLQYLGAHVDSIGPDGSVQVTNYFRASRPPPPGYAAFLHILDAQSGAFLANADHALPLPDGQWPVGKVVADTFRLRVPPGQSLELRLGFFRGNERLPPDPGAPQDEQRRVKGPIIGGSQGGSPAQALPEYRVSRRSGPIQLDGDLSDAAWQAAPEVSLVGSLDGAPASRRTTARLLYDDQFLYVAFDCQDDDVWGTFRERDQPLYTEEVVEIFLDADANGATYHEIEVSPHNVLFDAYFPARRTGMDLSWDSGVTSAVKVRGTLDDASDTDTGWSVELQIPLARLKDLPPGSPRAGARWRFNLYRLEAAGRKRIEGYAFSPPLVGDFHALPRFAWLVFQ